jgi:hypothetical protein
MNKLIVALIAGTFAALAGAQGTATTNQTKQQEVQQTTQAAEPSPAMKADTANKNVEKSKKHAKNKDKKAKQEMVDTTTKGVTNNYGQGTAMQAEKNTAASKADSATRKTPPKMGDNEKALQKAATP